MTSLMDAGADLHCKSSSGQTCVFNAACNNQHGAIELLVQRGASISESTGVGVTPLMSAAYRGHIECIETLIRMGADLDAVTDSGQDALYNSACAGQPEAAQLLITAGSKLNSAENEHGWTPLMAAAKNGHQNVMEVLFWAGANAELRDLDDQTIEGICAPSIQINRVLVGPDSPNPFADDS